MYSESLAQSRRRESMIRQPSDLFRCVSIIYGRLWAQDIHCKSLLMIKKTHSWSKRFLLAVGRPLLAMSRWSRCPSMCISSPMPRCRFRTLWFSEKESIAFQPDHVEIRTTTWGIRGCVLRFVPPVAIILKNYVSNNNNACVSHLFPSCCNGAHPSNHQRRIAYNH